MYKKVLSAILIVTMVLGGSNIGMLKAKAVEESRIDEEIENDTLGTGESEADIPEAEIPNVEMPDVENLEETMSENEELGEENNEKTETDLDELAMICREELPDGIYYIRATLSDKRVLAVEENLSSNKENIIIDTFENLDVQRWEVRHDSKGYITFFNEKSGKVLDISSEGEDTDKVICQKNAGDVSTQKWIARRDGNNYEIISADNGMVLDIKEESTSGIMKLQIHTPNDTEAQRFQMISANPKVISNMESIQEGMYRLIPKNKPGYAIDIQGSSFANKANVQIAPVSESLSQIFDVEYKDGYYVFINRYSGKVLDVEQGGIMSGTNVWQYTYNASKAQKWAVQENEDGSCSFISAHNGMALGIDGTNVQVQNLEATKMQNFILEKADNNVLERLAQENKDAIKDGTYYMRSALKSTSVVQTKDKSISNGINAVLHQFDKTSSQQWQVMHDEKGYVTFVNVNSGKVLDVSNGGRNKEKTVWQWTSNNSLAQKWIVQKTGNYCKIVSALNGMVLDVKGGKSSDNTGLQIWGSNNSTAQRFHMISTDPEVEKCDEVIPSGYYYIAAKSNTKYVLDICGGSDKNKANVQLYKKNNTFAQAFDIRYKDGYYTIRNMYSNKMLDVASGGFMPTTNVWQYNDNGTKAQKWSVKNNDDGSYTIISVHNGMALDIANGKTVSKSNIQVYTPNGSEAQKFVLRRAEAFYSGWYHIASAINKDYVLEIAGGNTANKANIQLYKINKTESQKWNAIKNSDGTFRFVNSKSKKVMDIANEDIKQNNIVWQWPYNSTAAQKWKVEKLEDNTWRIVSAKNKDYVLAIENGSATSKAKIVIQKWNDSKSQKWLFKETTPVKRIYQNPSQYYQIQDSITLKGGGYNLSYGYEGVKVMKVIKKLGLGSGIGMNGAFYSRSVESAVKKFQKKHGLRQTGVVDLTTWQKMGYTKTQWEQWGAYVSPLKVSIDSTRSEHIEAMISTAYSYLGTPYVIGASGPPGTGIDCSGLVMQALYSAGIDTSPINPVRHAKPGYEYESRNMWKSSKFKHVPYSQRQRGDLIFYQSSSGVVIHVAIYLGNNKVIESWPNKVVVWPIKNGSRSNVKGVVRPFV